MGLFNALNKGKKFDFELAEPLPNENYMKLADMPDGAKWLVKSIYRNTKSKFCEHYVILADNREKGVMHAIYGINLPSFMNETIQQIFASEEMIAAINNDKVLFSKSDELTTKAGKNYRTVVWEDVD